MFNVKDRVILNLDHIRISDFTSDLMDCSEKTQDRMSDIFDLVENGESPIFVIARIDKFINHYDEDGVEYDDFNIEIKLEETGWRIPLVFSESELVRI